MKNLRNILTALTFVISFAFLNAQTTYTIGNTEYYYGQYYSTTGKPMVKRSTANKNAFLKSRGYESVPYGYEIDHIIPLSQGGTDDPSNMQLLTVSQHRVKTARERANVSSSYYYRSTPSYSTSSSSYYRTPTVKTKKTYSPPSYTTPTYSVPTYTPSYSSYKYSSSSSRTIQTGPRGGRYYINSNGNKTYVKR
ncbi:HNH endonuclease signature motif containing protein [Aestuariivivens sediminis]|uniref:HNH endonuclease signature motif containing protein n=1 Tax=Aestuariivivens sediminis TaxID=2913557 RepID=UPI001F599176|nr:HNH endonuclease signature motif containing protein [Aestuariivivens sediminis]